MKKQMSGLAHCCHHNVHWEYCYSYGERVKYIKEYKPTEERELRLRLFRIIPDDKLPGNDSPEWAAYDKARVARDKARVAYLDEAWVARNRARAVYGRASAAYDKAWVAYLNKYRPELDQLHDELFPDCPWNGKSIFKEQEQ